MNRLSIVLGCDAHSQQNLVDENESSCLIVAPGLFSLVNQITTKSIVLLCHIKEKCLCHKMKNTIHRGMKR